jgi:hypothetical protein
VTGYPTLLRRRGRRGFRRFVFLWALVGLSLLFAPGAGGTPGDPSPPEVTPTIVGTIGGSGWYRSNVTVNWAIFDPQSIILGTECALASTLTADTPGQKITCRAWSDGGETTKSVTIKIDKTPPVASATADRLPDANGWYNRPLTVTASGTDATSGIASCTSTQYAGLDSVNAIIAGSCTDVAGNVTPASHAFKYDATPPSVTNLRTTPGNRSARVTWTASTDTQVIEVVRSPGRNDQAETVIFRGTSAAFNDTALTVGRKYRYRVSGFDQALNRADQSVVMTATGALFGPLPGERVTSPPNLVWAPVKGAAYYNLQIFRGRKVLSEWPVRPGFRLRRTWLYKGRRYRLRPGVYRWYVWPGRGRISAARYGDLLGSSTFVVTK